MDSAAHERLMLGDRQIEGARRVTATVRPTRIVYLVDPVDPAIVLAAIGGACLEWGGQFNFLIPCPPDGSPEEPWASILERFDPDLILDLVGAAPAFADQQVHAYLRPLRRWSRPLDRWSPGSACVFAALERWKRLRPVGVDHVLTVYNPLRQHPHPLMLGYRFGVMTDKELEGNWGLTWGHWERARHLSYTRVNAIPSDTLSEDDVVALLSPNGPMAPIQFNPLSDRPTTYWTLPMLTTIGLTPAEPSYSRYIPDDAQPAESTQTDEAYYRRVVIVGEPSSIPDLCLAWNLRAQRMSDPLPLWVAPSWLSRADLRPHLVNLSYPSSGGLSEARDQERRLHLVSASLGDAEFQSLAAELAATLGCQIDTHRLAAVPRFFTPSFRTGAREESVASFRHGFADVVLPDQRQLADFTRADSVEWAVRVDGYEPPRRPAAQFRREGGFHRDARLASDGITGGLGWLDSPRTLVSIATYSGIEVIEGMAEAIGSSARPSVAARKARATLDLVGGDDGLSVLASSRVFDLVRAMSRVAPRQSIQQVVRSYFRLHAERPPTTDELTGAEDEVQRELIAEPNPSRVFYQWNQVSQVLGPADDSSRRAVVRWLTARGILLRGVQLTCPKCGMTGWYLVDRLGSAFVCDGCRSEMPTPFEGHGAQWSYRLNELMASSVDQGVLAHLLAVRRLLGWSDVTGYVPGVEFTPVGDDPLGPIEVDFIAVKSGRVVIGECKMSGHLDDNEIDRLGELARRLDCSRIMYATPTSFDHRERVVERARHASSPASVEIWEADDLLDTRHVIGEEHLTPDDYLRWVAWRLGQRG